MDAEYANYYTRSLTAQEVCIVFCALFCFTFVGLTCINVDCA